MTAESWALKNTRFCYHTNDGKQTVLHVGSSLGGSYDYLVTPEGKCNEMFFGGQQLRFTNQGIPDVDKASQGLCVQVI